MVVMSTPVAAQTLGARIAASAGAAEALQGPLDGAWRLTDARGRTLFFIEIVDPVSGHGIEAVWRDPRGASGAVERIRRAGARMTLDFDRSHVSLGQTKDGWRGLLSEGGQPRRVTLRRRRLRS
jgi:hypothetical protein